MKTIPLSRGKETIVDDDVYEWASKHNWSVTGFENYFYAARKVTVSFKKFKHLRLHRVIADAKPGESVDHINGNTLDNRRVNLRVCTHAQNCQNRKKHVNGKSKYKGISWHKRMKRWTAHINKSDGLCYLGAFIIEEEAAKAYDRAAIETYGEFARLNFPQDTTCRVQ